MELIELRSFVEIVRTGSFSKASQKVFRTQGAVSHHIKKLETDLKVKLFERFGKRVELTEEGSILFNQASKFFSDLEEVRNRYADIADGQAGTLTIAANSSIAGYILPTVIKGFSAKFPKVKFRLLVSSASGDIPSLVSNGQADFGIGFKMNQGLQKNTDFVFWKSFDMILISPKNHPLTKRKRIRIEELGSYPLIMSRPGTILRKTVEEMLLRYGIPYEIVMEINMPDTIKKYVEMGYGLSIISSTTITPEDKKRLGMFRVSNLFGKLNYGVYYRKGTYVSGPMRQFINMFSPRLLTHMTTED
jgi:DNA-binding transcriptional LysR family regulator